jgi:hypothetical protein
MDNSCGPDSPFNNRECGAGRLKLILVIALIAAVGYIGYQYVPVAYQASRFKVAMQDNVDKASSLGQSNEWLRSQLRADANEHNVPPDAEITVERSGDGRVQARVQYQRAVVLPGYTYSYKFDYTAKSTQLLSTK